MRRRLVLLGTLLPLFAPAQERSTSPTPEELEWLELLEDVDDEDLALLLQAPEPAPAPDAGR
jgi:hypothetical protein